MITVHQSLARLGEAVSSGELADVAHRFGLEVVVQFGSSLTSTDPGDIDLAVGFEYGADRDFLGVVNALGELIPGDHVDVMDLDRADPVAQRAALDDKRVLFETSRTSTAEREIKAFIMYEDTRWLRRLQREALLS